MRQDVPVGQVAPGQRDGDRLPLAGLQFHTTEGFELAHAAVNGGVGETRVDLRHSSAGAVSGVGDGEGDG